MTVTGSISRELRALGLRVCAAHVILPNVAGWAEGEIGMSQVNIRYCTS